MSDGWNGQRVRALLQALGLSPTELGAKIGVTTQAVQNWMTDTNRIARHNRKELERLERKASRGGSPA